MEKYKEGILVFENNSCMMRVVFIFNFYAQLTTFQSLLFQQVPVFDVIRKLIAIQVSNTTVFQLVQPYLVFCRPRHEVEASAFHSAVSGIC